MNTSEPCAKLLVKDLKAEVRRAKSHKALLIVEKFQQDSWRQTCYAFSGTTNNAVDKFVAWKRSYAVNGHPRDYSGESHANGEQSERYLDWLKLLKVIVFVSVLFYKWLVAQRPHTKFAYLLQYTGNIILVFRLVADNRGVTFLLYGAFDELGVFWNRVRTPVVPSDLVERCYSFLLATIQ